MTDNAETYKKQLTCIICPVGCQMEITVQDNGFEKKVISTADNGCPRGPQYAQKELIDPRRTLTTCASVTGGELKLIPCKTDGEIPVALLKPCMEILRRTVCKAPIHTGDILVRDILGTGIHVKACADCKPV
jgi:CxxC motif-containing protein